MYDHRHHRNHGSATGAQHTAAREVGRTTLVQQLESDPVHSPMFAAEPQWEPIEAEEADAQPWPSAALAAKTTANSAATTTGHAGAGHSSAPAIPSEPPA